VCVGCSEQCNCGALCNIVVKPMRVCRRGKSVACGTPCAEGASLRGTACGTCKELSSNKTKLATARKAWKWRNAVREPQRLLSMLRSLCIQRQQNSPTEPLVREFAQEAVSILWEA
jgi:hypothetical protein